MNSQNTLSITNARGKIFDLVQKTAAGARFFLTDHGKAKAVLMSADEFDSWQETMAVMRDFPNLDKDIKEAEKDYKKGNYITLDELLKKEGYVLADKGKKKYGVQNSFAKKGSKRSSKN
ncbi:MAG: type II toxin-antitoxin system Phd/YefM family antitoxin [Patescibacteria group bacterium]